jgi:hypothetical protein
MPVRHLSHPAARVTHPQLEPYRLADEAAAARLGGGAARLLPPPGSDPWGLDVFTSNALTRSGVGAGPLAAHTALSTRAQRPAPRLLVVDVREFMAVLPGVLHRQGFHLTPVTLEVGRSGAR